MKMFDRPEESAGRAPKRAKIAEALPTTKPSRKSHVSNAKDLHDCIAGQFRLLYLLTCETRFVCSSDHLAHSLAACISNLVLSNQVVHTMCRQVHTSMTVIGRNLTNACIKGCLS